MSTKKTETATYILTALSNMHVGSGDANYGIVDKEVQRDVTDHLPTIHSSGLKGAVKELFEEKLKIHEDEIKYIFGSGKDDSGKAKANYTGNYHFFNAMMLSIPVRSNQQPFYRATSPEILKAFGQKMTLFNHPQVEKINEAINVLSNLEPKVGAPIVFGGETQLVLEDFRATHTELEANENYQICVKLIGERIAIFNHSDLKQIAKELPVIARNSLENGESVNLWYEEVVPRETRFYFTIKYYEEKPINRFENYVQLNKNLIQVGGNASIGYGYSLFENLNNIL